MNDAARGTSLRALSRLVEGWTAATTPADVLAALAAEGRGVLPFSACTLVLPTPWRTWRAAAARPYDVEFRTELPTEAVQTLERFVAHGQQLAIPDLLLPPWRDTSYRNVLWKDGTRSAVLVPLTGPSGMGTLSLTSSQPDCYTAAEQPAITLLAWMVAAALRVLPR